LLVEKVASKAEVDELCRMLGHLWRERLFTPMVTLWTFLVQVLDPDASCRKAASRVLAFLSVTCGLDASHNPSAYCRARKRLPDGLLQQLTGLVARKLADKVRDKDLWHGRVVKVVDGSSVSMPDTEANQAAFPQHRQKPGCGFPIARLVGVFNLLTGALCDLALGALTVGETILFHTLWDSLEGGDVILADRHYCSYGEIALLRARGIDVVYRLHHRREADFRQGHRLGRDDRLVQWTKGARPKWMSVEQFEALPQTVSLRMVRTQGKGRGEGKGPIVVVTTLLDPTAYPARDITDLYRRRWEVELDLRYLKTTMKMEVLRTQTPDMIIRELWAYMLAYNLIRTLMWDAGTRYRVAPMRISFKAAIGEMMTMWLLTPAAARGRDLTKPYTILLHSIASHKLPYRPNRSQPRVRKRRPKNHRLMTKPRSQY
jgi:hypothetical protein